MPVTRRSNSTGKRVEVAGQEGTNQPPPNQAVQSEAQDESLSQTSPTPPSPEDLRREAAPQVKDSASAVVEEPAKKSMITESFLLEVPNIFFKSSVGFG